MVKEEDFARDQEDAAKKEVNVSSSGRGTDTIREVILPTPGICFFKQIQLIDMNENINKYLVTMSLDGLLLGSEVDRLNGGLTSSVDGVVPGEESEVAADPSEALTRNGTGLGVLIFWSGLILIISDERT